tara:strand:- start:1144 stop:1440 length:297 start_codon:yes stop_codon:yes gene_type:complete
MKKNNLTLLPFRKIRAINDPIIIKYIKSIFLNDPNFYKSLNDENIHNNFLKSYIKWIKSSKINNLKGLEKYKFACFSNGSSQVFDYFYAKYKKKDLEY